MRAVRWVAVAVAMAVVLAACGGGGDAPDEAPDKTIGPPACLAVPGNCT